MPPFVRAVRSFKRGSRTPPYTRLNRGFDGPESKCHAPAPETVSIAARVGECAIVRGYEHAAPIRGIKPVSQHDVPPDAFRGPPLSHAIA